MWWLERLRFAIWIWWALFAFSLWTAASAAWFVSQAQTVDGVVIDQVVHSRRGRTERPIFEYTFDGRRHEASAVVGDPGIDVGDEVEVLVDPSDPGDARLATNDSVWKTPLLTLSLTVILGVFLAMSRVFVRRVVRRRGAES